MDKKIANNIIVGVFVLVGVVFFVYILFTIGGGKGVFASEYTLYAKFDHVKGLNYGSEVSLAGLRAGTVKRITIDNMSERKELIVEMAIDKEMRDKIRQDSDATILTSGVLGDKYIEISIGSPSSPMLEPGATVASRQAPDLFAKSGTLIDDVTRHFEKGSDIDLLVQRLNVVAEHLASVTGELENGHGLFNELVRGQSATHISSATDHLNNILQKIDNGDGSLGALINDPTVYEDLKSLMGGAKRSAVLKYFMSSFIESGQEAEKKKDGK